ncbi:protein of unknown function [Pseudomonas sp. JV551A1]|nr:protein of unknown function [Pseudomonas sp. JV551A1]
MRPCRKVPTKVVATRQVAWKLATGGCYKGNPASFNDSFTMPSARDYCAAPPPKNTSVPT